MKCSLVFMGCCGDEHCRCARGLVSSSSGGGASGPSRGCSLQLQLPPWEAGWGGGRPVHRGGTGVGGGAPDVGIEAAAAAASRDCATMPELRQALQTRAWRWRPHGGDLDGVEAEEKAGIAEGCACGVRIVGGGEGRTDRKEGRAWAWVRRREGGAQGRRRKRRMGSRSRSRQRT